MNLCRLWSEQRAAHTYNMYRWMMLSETAQTWCRHERFQELRKPIIQQNLWFKPDRYLRLESPPGDIIKRWILEPKNSQIYSYLWSHQKCTLATLYVCNSETLKYQVQFLFSWIGFSVIPSIKWPGPKAWNGSFAWFSGQMSLGSEQKLTFAQMSTIPALDPESPGSKLGGGTHTFQSDTVIIICLRLMESAAACSADSKHMETWRKKKWNLSRRKFCMNLSGGCSTPFRIIALMKAGCEFEINK